MYLFVGRYVTIAYDKINILSEIVQPERMTHQR